MLSYNRNTYNNTDDNTLSSTPNAVDEIEGLLQTFTMSVTQWSRCYQVKVNPEKFQPIIFVNMHDPNDLTFDIAGKYVPCN